MVTSVASADIWLSRDRIEVVSIRWGKSQGNPCCRVYVPSYGVIGDEL